MSPLSPHVGRCAFGTVRRSKSYEGCHCLSYGALAVTLPTRLTPRESLAVLRFVLVVGSLAPLFLLWAIRGNDLIPDNWLIPVCLGLAVVPNLILMGRRNAARRAKSTRASDRLHLHDPSAVVWDRARWLARSSCNNSGSRTDCVHILAPKSSLYESAFCRDGLPRIHDLPKARR